ncbi:hypothetical protein ACMA5I_14390 [Paracoccaceae bacterium GXU_MW_L88]
MDRFWEVVGIYRDSNDRTYDGASDIEYFQHEGAAFLAVSSESESTASIFKLDDTGAVTELIDRYADINATIAATDVTLMPRGDVIELVVSARYAYRYNPMVIREGGDLGHYGKWTEFTEGYGTWTETTPLIRGEHNYFAAASYIAPGLEIYQSHPKAQYEVMDRVTSIMGKPIGQVLSTAEFTRGDETFLFFASDNKNLLGSFSVDDAGQLTARDVVMPSDDTGFNDVMAMDVVEVGSRDFLLAASWATNRVITYEIGASGDLTEQSFIEDSRVSRFGKPRDIESFEVNGRHYAVIGGADDGFSLLYIDDAGKLHLIQSFENTMETTLKDVATLESVVDGMKVHLYIGSNQDGGFTHVVLDLTTIDAQIARTGYINDRGNVMMDNDHGLETPTQKIVNRLPTDADGALWVDETDPASVSGEADHFDFAEAGPAVPEPAPLVEMAEAVTQVMETVSSAMHAAFDAVPLPDVGDHGLFAMDQGDAFLV